MTETYVEIIDVITTNTTQQRPQYTPPTPTAYIYYTPALRLFIIDILSKYTVD